MLTANTSFFAGGRLVAAGELVDERDPIVTGREALFDRDDTVAVVEQATAAPGQKRTTKRPVKRTTAKD
jgi:hypothetical protein